MPLRDYKGYLFDIAEACEKIMAYSQALTLEDYENDELTRLAIERVLTIVGEALAQARQHYPEIVSQISYANEIVGFRNKLVHAYLHIDNDTVWGIIQTFIPVLQQEVRIVLAQAEPADTD
jgi:uncharacterized protein with HEPN domain